MNTGKVNAWTPGPWRASIDANNQFSRDEAGAIKPLCLIEGNLDKNGNGDSIASLTTRFYNGGASRPRSLEGEWQANALLISLGPTMAEELIELAEYWRHGTPVHAGSEVAVRVLKLVDGLLKNNA